MRRNATCSTLVDLDEESNEQTADGSVAYTSVFQQRRNQRFGKLLSRYTSRDRIVQYEMAPGIVKIPKFSAQSFALKGTYQLIGEVLHC